MTPGDLPAWFDGLPEDIRETLALFGDQGFEDAAALIGLIGEVSPERPKVSAIKINNPWPYDGAEGRARFTGSLDTGGSFMDDEDDDYRQSTTACCPRQTIPDSCSCLEECGCLCRDCRCDEDDEDDFPEYELP